jgi:hypothetical protein
MRLPPRLVLALLLLAAIAPWLTQAQQPGPTLTYIPGSSAKVYQINGDCDWPEWDATIAKPHPTCAPTFSQTAANADILGNQTKNDPQTTRGGEYAPLMIERFTEVEDNKLKIFYTLSTWNPYAVVLMESDFNIDREWPHDWDR